MLIFTGLVLFVITFAVNFLGRWIAGPRRAEAGPMSSTLDTSPDAHRLVAPSAP